ncbi:MAG: hypothetical protein OXH78_02160 [Acidimicrobiaceae bacterium]|nr:hypothetical protein [Acidimicrobiaceae bacterium]
MPITTRFGPPVVAADLTADSTPPEAVSSMSGRTPEERPRIKPTDA